MTAPELSQHEREIVDRFEAAPVLAEAWDPEVCGGRGSARGYAEGTELECGCAASGPHVWPCDEFVPEPYGGPNDTNCFVGDEEPDSVDEPVPTPAAPGTDHDGEVEAVANWLATEYGELLNPNPADDPPGYWEFQARELLAALAARRPALAAEPVSRARR